MVSILIVDDETKLRELLRRVILLENESFEVEEAESIKSTLKLLEKKNIDVIICDVKLPDGSGLDIIQEIKTKHPFTEIIMLTAYGNISDAVKAIKLGAFDYITKGDNQNRIIPLLQRAIEKVELIKKLHYLQHRLEGKYSFEHIIGQSRSFLEAVELAKKVAKTDVPVLLLGETGSGKEVFAQAIHQASRRSHKTFIAVNCAAFSKELLESELFGHKAGAFTGAIKDKKGLFEEAHEGTLFLDEIGEMPSELQAKLLRVLESGEFIKVGETKPTFVNVRIIAATNRNIHDEMKAGHFRDDLFYRLSVVQIHIPPLRERKEDIPVLASSFAEYYAHKMGKKIKSLSKDFIEILEQQPWKGNVRELKNVIERAVILSEGEQLRPADLPYEMQQYTSYSDDHLSAFSLASAEKVHIQKVLNYTKGNKMEAARLLKISLATLYRKIEAYRLS